jgi:hypothetical protein
MQASQSLYLSGAAMMILRSSPASPFVRAWAHHLKTIVAQLPETIVAQATGANVTTLKKKQR